MIAARPYSGHRILSPHPYSWSGKISRKFASLFLAYSLRIHTLGAGKMSTSFRLEPDALRTPRAQKNMLFLMKSSGSERIWRPWPESVLRCALSEYTRARKLSMRMRRELPERLRTALVATATMPGADAARCWLLASSPGRRSRRSEGEEEEKKKRKEKAKSRRNKKIYI